MRDGTCADSTNELCAFLHQAGSLAFHSNHESCHVVEEDDGMSTLVTKTNESTCLVGFGGEDNRILVGDYTRETACVFQIS